MSLHPDWERPADWERSGGTPETHDQHAGDCCGGRIVDPRIARHFDKSMRERAAGGEMPQMVVISERLLEMLSDVASERLTLLELGCGSGAMTVALLERGATQADGVDLSSESLHVARRRAIAAGVADRARFELGDAAQVALRRHDWVVLDRVMCCYPELEQLLANAVPAAGRRFAFSVPYSRGWQGVVNRLISFAENATNRLRGRPCPGYVHSIERIEARLSAAGFRRRANGRTGLWYAAVWERAGA